MMEITGLTGAENGTSSRSTPRPPSSTGTIESIIGNAASMPPRSANSVDIYKSRYGESKKSSDPSPSSDGSRHGNAASSALYYGGSFVPGSIRTHRLHPVAVAPGSDPRLLMRHRRVGGGGGFEDPSYAAASANNGRAGDGANGSSSKPNSGAAGRKVAIPLAVLLWYLLGVVSIASSKILLSAHDVPPSVLTVQQLVIGMTLLRILLEIQTFGENNEGGLLCGGLQPIPMQGDDSDAKKTSPEKCCESGVVLKRKSSNVHAAVVSGGGDKSSKQHGVIPAILALIIPSKKSKHIPNHMIQKQLFLAGIFFALGFLFTNYGFRSAEAAFVETVKAAEPFTSATVAVAWGIERLGAEEVTSLTGIVAGVVLSTLGHRGDRKPAAASGNALDVPSQSLASKCLIVMAANLCFSFRGLHQKLFRASPQGRATTVDDLNLQYRMQQIGILILIVPTLLGNASSVLIKLRHFFMIGGSVSMKDTFQYILLSFVNGLAFTSYNLASTHVLTRLSVVHHAALNCIRRVFAIVVTSVIFGLRMTMLQVLGIALAVIGFFSYIHYKLKKEMRERTRKELRRKWGGIVMDDKGRRLIGKKSSSLSPVNNAVG